MQCMAYQSRTSAHGGHGDPGRPVVAVEQLIIPGPVSAAVCRSLRLISRGRCSRARRIARAGTDRTLERRYPQDDLAECAPGRISNAQWAFCHGAISPAQQAEQPPKRQGFQGSVVAIVSFGDRDGLLSGFVVRHGTVAESALCVLLRLVNKALSHAIDRRSSVLVFSHRSPSSV